MAIKTPAYFKWRDGRPRWEPGPGVRHAGFRGRDLRDAAGQWLALGPAIEAAAALNAEVAEARATGRRPKRHKAAKNPHTVRALHAKWTASPKYQRLRASTREDYRLKAAIFLAEFGDHTVASLAPHHLYQWWEELYAARGHAMANGVLAVARAMLSHAPRIGWRPDNPARNLGLEGVAPRVVVWTPSEVAAFVDVADTLGFHDCADAVVVALHTGQRQGDVLTLCEDRIDAGRARFVQSKTGARVTVPLTDELAARLDTNRARRRARRQSEPGAVVDLAGARRLFSFDKARLRHDFDQVRAIVAATLPEIAGKTFQDLRDTAITRLALASCTVVEIRAITGHSMETIHSVLKHYLALDDRMATAAIAKLKIWMQEEGIAL